MASSQPTEAPALAAGRGALPFGFLAYFGTVVSVAFCYAQVLITLIAPLFGLVPVEFNPDAQAVLMSGFALAALVGLWRDQRVHGHKAALAVGALGAAIILGTLHGFYHVLILVLGYLFLVASTFVNQTLLLGRLHGDVRSQASQLAELNGTLEQRVADQVTEIERLARLKRFLAPQVANLITGEGKEALLDSHRRYIACLFCDIRDFTPLSESLEPEEVMAVLQAYHEQVGRLVAARGGTIGYRAGDGLMVFFNDPLPCDAPVLEAVRLALDIRESFEAIRSKWERLGHRLGLGVGIASGYATLGVIGYEGRTDYTAIGNVVNVAARLCDRAADGQILLNHRAYLEVEEQVEAKPLGVLELKGVGRASEVYDLVRCGAR